MTTGGQFGEARVVGLLYADVEGSTQLLRRAGDTYSEILARYREILRSAVAEGNGTEQGTEGDSFLALFPRPVDACTAALAVQQQLSSEEWPDKHELKARIGLHSGETLLGAGGWTGLAIHEAARIGSAAHGGQVVVSPLMKSLVEGTAGGRFVFEDLGTYRLKDLDGAIRLFQLCRRDAEEHFPPLRTPESAEPPQLPEAHLEPRGSQVVGLVRLTKQRTTFGRADEADVSLNADSTVSRLHACIDSYPGSFVLRDLSSTNGTFVNGERLTGDRPLQPGDEIRIGANVFVFQAAAVADAGATATGDQPPDLTRRERDVLLELCRPLADKTVAFPSPASVADIAQRLVIGQATVKFHLENLFNKFGLIEPGEGRRLGLANEALKRGAVTLGELRQQGNGPS